MTVSTSPSKHTVHSPFLLPAGSGGENTGDTGGLSGELGAVTAKGRTRQTIIMWFSAGFHWGNPQKPELLWSNLWGNNFERHLGFSSGLCPYPTLFPPSIKHHYLPLGYDM